MLPTSGTSILSTS